MLKIKKPFQSFLISKFSGGMIPGPPSKSCMVYALSLATALPCITKPIVINVEPLFLIGFSYNIKIKKQLS